MKKNFLILFVSLMIIGCGSMGVKREEVKVIDMVSNTMPDPHIVKTNADPKSVAVKVTSSVPNTQKEQDLLRCLAISELQKSNMKARATAEECRKCEGIVKGYGTYERIEGIYGLFQCQEYQDPNLFEILIDVKRVKRVADAWGFFFGPVIRGQAEMEVEASVSVNTQEGKVLLVKSELEAKAPGCGTLGTLRFDAGYCNGAAGFTNQAVNETAVSIAKMFRAIKR